MSQTIQLNCTVNAESKLGLCYKKCLTTFDTFCTYQFIALINAINMIHNSSPWYEKNTKYARVRGDLPSDISEFSYTPD